jgi:predicted DNA-binding transcriptional regulator AlpA
MKPEPEILTREELARLLRCKPRAIYSLTRSRATENRLPTLRLPIGLRWRRSDVETWLAASAQTAQGGQ